MGGKRGWIGKVGRIAVIGWIGVIGGIAIMGGCRSTKIIRKAMTVQGPRNDTMQAAPGVDSAQSAGVRHGDLREDLLRVIRQALWGLEAR